MCDSQADRSECDRCATTSSNGGRLQVRLIIMKNLELIRRKSASSLMVRIQVRELALDFFDRRQQFDAREVQLQAGG
jgi:hypothetical protein